MFRRKIRPAVVFTPETPEPTVPYIAPGWLANYAAPIAPADLYETVMRLHKAILIEAAPDHPHRELLIEAARIVANLVNELCMVGSSTFARDTELPVSAEANAAVSEIVHVLRYWNGGKGSHGERYNAFAVAREWISHIDAKRRIANNEADERRRRGEAAASLLHHPPVVIA